MTSLSEYTEITDRERATYRPIRDYAVIGDGHGAALVSHDGGIDWCCLGHFDAEPSFARLLDAETGGSFDLRPTDSASSRRAYRAGTNILVTSFETPEGRAEVIDFMPVGRRPGATAHDYRQLNAPGWLVRIVRGLQGRVAFGLHFEPIPGFSTRDSAGLQRERNIAWGTGIPALHGTAELHLDPAGRAAFASFEVEAGEDHCFVLAPAPMLQLDVRAAAERMLAITTAFWREWLGYCRYRGPHEAAVQRSALALKMMTYAPTGGLVAAPTTSLPEQIGGSRNWDYRFCWLRDSAFSVYAMAAIGFVGEARGFVEFLKAQRFHRDGIHLMHGVRGDAGPEERVVDGFSGYLDSLPVRIGNAAQHQRRHDIYGEILDMALLYRSLGGRFDDEERASLCFLADEASQVWRLPDNGIWEMRIAPRHFVYSKVMCWVAIDRAIRLFGDNGRWGRERQLIVDAVFEHGLHDGHLVQAFGTTHTDAALLVVLWLGFPLGKPLIRRTIDAILAELRVGDYLRRYRLDDGLEGQDGAFLMSSFWLVDALLFLEREREATELFERLLARANDTGLFAEEIDPESHAFLGNFPQALVHLAIINTAVRLRLYRQGGVAAISGSQADRARRHLEPAAGTGRLWTWLRQSIRTGRFIGSRRSVLPLG